MLNLKNVVKQVLPGLALVGLALVLSLPPAPASAKGVVEVKYIDADHFADVPRNAIDRERALQSLTAHLQSLGAQLPDGQALNIEVTDIDLAGELRWWRTNEVRVLRGLADWPRISLSYTLQAEGRTLASGKADITDMNYLQQLRGHELAQGDLGYEKRMLSHWFAQTFIDH